MYNQCKYGIHCGFPGAIIHDNNQSAFLIVFFLTTAERAMLFFICVLQSRKERKEIAIEGLKKGRNGIEFFTGLASLNLLHYLEHC